MILIFNGVEVEVEIQHGLIHSFENYHSIIGRENIKSWHKRQYLKLLILIKTNKIISPRRERGYSCEFHAIILNELHF